MKKCRLWMRATACLLFCGLTVAASAQQLTTLVAFDGTNGKLPNHTQLTQGPDGNFYGVTLAGGTSNDGAIFELAPDGTLTTLHSFDSTDGAVPDAGLVLGTDGNLYGTTSLGGTTNMGTVFRITIAGVLTTLHSFAGSPDGAQPVAGLTQGVDGQFYGTTANGGSGCQPAGCGTFYKMSYSGQVTVLHNFLKTDGAAPEGALALGTDGNFYGSTLYGGADNGGVGFKVTPGGKLTVLHAGVGSQAGLIQASDGNLYGTTPALGTYGRGTIYRLTPSGELTVLYNFCPQLGCADGSGPQGGLTQATDGYLYGTTFGGGAAPGSYGTIFKISLDGVFSNVWDFNPPSGGVNPSSALLQATNGEFYGTTNYGGTFNDGVVFRLSTGLDPFVAFVRNPAKAGQEFGILGQELYGTSSITLNGTPVSYSLKSNSLIVATVPAGATTGFVSVKKRRQTLNSNVPFHVVR